MTAYTVYKMLLINVDCIKYSIVYYFSFLKRYKYKARNISCYNNTRLLKNTTYPNIS
jgi:predicted ferric reductase